MCIYVCVCAKSECRAVDGEEEGRGSLHTYSHTYSHVTGRPKAELLWNIKKIYSRIRTTYAHTHMHTYIGDREDGSGTVG